MMLKALFKYAPVQIFSALSVFALISVHTRFLTTAEYGVLAILLLVMEVVRALSAQWANSSILRLLPSESAERKPQLASVAATIIIAGYIVAQPLIGLGLYINDVFDIKLFIGLSVLLACKATFLFLSEYARILEKTKKYQLGVLTQSISSMLITLTFLSYDNSLLSALCALSVSFLCGIVFVFTPFSLSLSSLLHKDAKKIYKYGIPLMLSGFIGAISARLDRFLIAEYLDFSQTGIYAALSNMLLGLGALVFMVVALPSYPELAKKVNDRHALYKAHTNYLHFLLIITLPSLLGLCVLAEPIVKLLLTEEYLKSGVELIYLMCASVFVVNLKAHYVDHGLQFINATRYLPKISVASLSINALCMMILIPKYGLFGAALAFLFASSSSLLLTTTISLIKGYRFILTMQHLKPVLATGVMVFVLNLLKAKDVLLEHHLVVYISVYVLVGLLCYSSVLAVLHFQQCIRFWNKRYAK